jgi:HAD superfamily hydrolase (TIGR01509 family)
MLDISKIRAITLDLDDTLWPVGPTIERAEKALSVWLTEQAPRTARVFADPEARLALRQQVVNSRPDWGHNLSALRRESIRLALYQSGEDTALAQAAFDVFFAERQRVDLYADARPALAFLASRFPVVALSNGNADVSRVGLSEFFAAGLSAQDFGVGKPDPRIFHAAAQAAGVSAGQVLHVGDDAALDVLGGLGAGMQTVWVNRGEHVWSHEARPHHTVTDLAQLCALLA